MVNEIIFEKHILYLANVYEYSEQMLNDRLSNHINQCTIIKIDNQFNLTILIMKPKKKKLKRPKVGETKRN